MRHAILIEKRYWNLKSIFLVKFSRISNSNSGWVMSDVAFIPFWMLDLNQAIMIIELMKIAASEIYWMLGKSKDLPIFF